MRDAVEVSRQIRVDYLSMSRVQQCGDLCNSVQRTTIRAIGVLLWLQVGLENRFENQHRRRHDDTIFDCRDSQRSRLSRLTWLGDVNPPHRLRAIPLRPKFFRQFVQPLLPAVLLDVVERLTIDARGSIIRLTDPMGVPQYIGPIHLVVQRIESVVGRFLRFGMQRLL